MFVISRDLDFQIQRELTLYNKLEMLDFKETSETQNSTTLEESQSQNEKVEYKYLSTRAYRTPAL